MPCPVFRNGPFGLVHNVLMTPEADNLPSILSWTARPIPTRAVSPRLVSYLFRTPLLKGLPSITDLISPLSITLPSKLNFRSPSANLDLQINRLLSLVPSALDTSLHLLATSPLTAMNAPSRCVMVA